MNINLKALEKEFGSINYNGRKIILANAAEPTSRLLNEYSNNRQYQGDGPTYIAEWSASGYTEEGKVVRVRWHFEILRSGESTNQDYDYTEDTLPEDYDWDNVRDVLD